MRGAARAGRIEWFEQREAEGQASGEWLFGFLWVWLWVWLWRWSFAVLCENCVNCIGGALTIKRPIVSTLFSILLLLNCALRILVKICFFSGLLHSHDEPLACYGEKALRLSAALVG